MTRSPKLPAGTITQDETKGERLKGSDVEDAITACARTIAETRDFALTFGTAEEVADPSAARVTRRPPYMSEQSRTALRGESDLAGLYRSRHDFDRPSFKNSDQLVVNALERVRLEAAGANDYAGLAGNLAAALRERCLKPLFALGPQELKRSETLGILLRETIAPDIAPKIRLEFVEVMRDALSPVLAPYVDSLRACLCDQDAFERISLEIARALPALDPGVEDLDEAEEIDARGDSDPGPVEGDEVSKGEGAGLKSASEEATGDAPLIGSPEKAPAQSGSSGGSAAPSDRDEPSPQSTRRSASAGEGETPTYKVFTRAFDRTVTADILLSEFGSASTSDGVGTTSTHRKDAARLSASLRRALLAERPRGWDRDQTDGSIDPTRLARVVTDPASGRWFRQPKDEPFTDTVLTLLVDNSSSMRGEPLRVVAEATELIARAVESCGVRVEVLGFTTQSWRGGRARTAWIDAGQPKDPGRVSELLHIIFKQADAPVRTLRSKLALVGVKGLPKENVDGEALDWAYSRILRRPERRKAIIMISDGAPSEETTLSLSHYPGNVLEAHLRSVISKIERDRAAELFAIGIGYEVERLYPASVRIDDASNLAAALTHELPSLLLSKNRPRRKAA